jgi:uncharacterized membrane protein YcaP (DUF421 family)
MEMWTIDWQELFVPSGSLAGVALRGATMYLALFGLFRLLPRRHIGLLGTSDLLVVVLIADAAQNGMAGEYRSVTEGLVLVGTILLIDYVIDWLDYRFPALRLNAARRVPLVRDGRIVHGTLRREKITEEELMTQLREQGIADLGDIAHAYLEGDGHVSVIRHGRDTEPHAPRRKTV